MERSSPRDVQMSFEASNVSSARILYPSSAASTRVQLPWKPLLSIPQSVSKIKDVRFVANRKRSALPLGRSGLRREIREAWDHP
jgi:hypothetical protein